MCMIIPTALAFPVEGECISYVNCYNVTELAEPTMCEFIISVPEDMTSVFIDVDQGSRLYGGRHFDMVISEDDTNISIFANRETLPLYIVCSEASSDYEREQYIEMTTIGIDDNYSSIPVNNDYEVIDRTNMIVLVLAGLFFVLGLFGMIMIISKFFK